MLNINTQQTSTDMTSSKSIQKLLLEQLEGQNAHVSFDQAVQGLTYKQTGIKVEGIPHTIWELIEHIRLAQDDILEFCENPEYQALEWPDDYWPKSHQPESNQEFQQAVQAIGEGIESMRKMISNPEIPLQTPFAHGDGQTLFREAMLIVDHNAYHIGQIVLIRRLLESW